MSMYRREWDCCDSVTETHCWEPEQCPLCELDSHNTQITQLTTALAAAKEKVASLVEALKAATKLIDDMRTWWRNGLLQNSWHPGISCFDENDKMTPECTTVGRYASEQTTAIKQALAKHRARNPWIDATKVLPEDDGFKMLWFSTHNELRKGQYYDGYWWVQGGKCIPSHWMQLTPPP